MLPEQSAQACVHIDDQLSALGCAVQGATGIVSRTDPVSPVQSHLLQLISRHLLHPHAFADNTKIYGFCKPSTIDILC